MLPHIDMDQAMRESANVTPGQIETAKKLIVEKMEQKVGGEKAALQIKAAFKKFDTDGSGVLEFGEFSMALDDMKCMIRPGCKAALFQLADIDGSGSICYDEFVRFVAPDYFAQTLPASQKRAAYYDARKPAAEYADPEAGIKNLIKQMQANILQANYQKKFGEDTTEPIMKAFKFFDTDKSGYLERNEFAEALERLCTNGMSDSDKAQVFDWYDVDGSGAISYKEFAEALMAGQVKSALGEIESEHAPKGEFGGRTPYSTLAGDKSPDSRNKDTFWGLKKQNNTSAALRNSGDLVGGRGKVSNSAPMQGKGSYDGVPSALRTSGNPLKMTTASTQGKGGYDGDVRSAPANSMSAKMDGRKLQPHLYNSGNILTMDTGDHKNPVRAQSSNAMVGKVAGPDHLKKSGDIIGHRGDVRERSNMQAKFGSTGPRNNGQVVGCRDAEVSHVEGLKGDAEAHKGGFGFTKKASTGPAASQHLRNSGNIITNSGDVRSQGAMQGKARSPGPRNF